ncbi:hypothetical protein [Pseudoclavibacter helvolus]|uniref:hypothetical protein n=1 Tax=Pseudoclavibacter helvolus TaxID=255205 RepID=UPI003736E44C
MRSRTLTTSALLAGAVLLVLTGCSALERAGIDQVVDERDWTGPEATNETILSKEEAIAACVEAVVTRFDIDPDAMYPESSASATKLNQDWAITATPSTGNADQPTYYCLTDGSAIRAHTKAEYQTLTF